jgi:hypothetical protein
VTYGPANTTLRKTERIRSPARSSLSVESMRSSPITFRQLAFSSKRTPRPTNYVLYVLSFLLRENKKMSSSDGGNEAGAAGRQTRALLAARCRSPRASRRPSPPPPQQPGPCSPLSCSAATSPRPATVPPTARPRYRTGAAAAPPRSSWWPPASPRRTSSSSPPRPVPSL